MSKRAVPRLDCGHGWWKDALLVAGLLLLATALNFLLPEHLSRTSRAMVYLLAVVIASCTTGLAAALACSFGAVALLHLLFAPPTFAFGQQASRDLISLATMLAVAVVISRMGVALRRETQQARRGEVRARLLQELATELAGVGSRGDAERVGRRFLAQALHGDQTRAEQVLQSCLAGHTKDGTADELLQAICAQLSQALARLALAGSVEVAQERARWHRAQSSFLAGISHDFRTPLAALVTAASSLQLQRDKLGVPEQRRLTGIILDEAAQLAVLTENTLQLARLEHAGEIHRDWQSIEEIVGAVLARVRRRHAAASIRARVPGQLPLIQADPVLLAQLLDNLLENALQGGAGPIELAVEADGDRMTIAMHHDMPVGEAGEGFDSLRPSDRSGRRGVGVGLAVCHAIARAHGAELRVEPREGGGSSFVLSLPVQPMQLFTEVIQ